MARMEWSSDFEDKWVIFRFSDGSIFQAVGPLEIEADGRVMFRVAVKVDNDTASLTRIWLELPPGGGAEGIRRIYTQGVGAMEGMTFSLSERLRWA